MTLFRLSEYQIWNQLSPNGVEGGGTIISWLMAGSPSRLVNESNYPSLTVVIVKIELVVCKILGSTNKINCQSILRQ